MAMVGNDPFWLDSSRCFENLFQDKLEQFATLIFAANNAMSDSIWKAGLALAVSP